MLSLRNKIKLINWWPPVLGTGIHLKHISESFDTFEVELKLRWYNKNLIGIHYGGSLYSMCDPWYMFILMINLGKDYIVMDKGAAIRYMLPGTGKLTCRFHLSREKIAAIKNEVDTIGKQDYTFLCEIKNEEGEVVAEVDKVVYVRNKKFDWEKFERENQEGAKT